MTLDMKTCSHGNCEISCGREMWSWEFRPAEIPQCREGNDVRPGKRRHSRSFHRFDGGRIKEIAQLYVHVETEKGEYGPVEDVHMALDHLISSYLAHVD